MRLTFHLPRPIYLLISSSVQASARLLTVMTRTDLHKIRISQCMSHSHRFHWRIRGLPFYIDSSDLADKSLLNTRGQLGTKGEMIPTVTKEPPFIVNLNFAYASL